MLKIFPESTDQSLSPINRADSLLIDEITQTSPNLKNLLLVNDAYGALHTHFDQAVSYGIQDSYNGQRAINYNRESLSVQTTSLLGGTLDPIPSNIDGVVMKIPKSLDLFEFQLYRITETVPEETPIWAGGMAKYLPKSFFDIFSQYTQQSTYSQCEGKARFYKGTLQKPEKPHKNLAQPNHITYQGITFATFPGVFSQKRIDPGTALLLKHFPRVPTPSRVVDAGCGCGILLTKAAELWPEAELIGTDDSALAIVSAEETARLGAYNPTLMHTHITEGIQDKSVDLVLCNPPFHQGHRVSLDLGFSFIHEAYRILKQGGSLALVGNRHIGYDKYLKKQFNSTKIIGQNRIYRVYLTEK